MNIVVVLINVEVVQKLYYIVIGYIKLSPDL
jgi:hypothetical protein